MLSMFYVTALIFAIETVLKHLVYLDTVHGRLQKKSIVGTGGVKFARGQSPSVSFIVFLRSFAFGSS